MGLLDFMSKNGSSTNGQDPNSSTPSVPDFSSIQQSYTNQSLANVAYPMANPVQPLQQPVTSQTDNMQPSQVQSFNSIQQPIPSTPQPIDIMDTNPQQNSPASNMQIPSIPQIQADQSAEEKDVPPYEYVDPSKHPVLPEVMPNQGHTSVLPEGIKVTTYGESTPSSESNNQSEHTEFNSVDSNKQITSGYLTSTPQDNTQSIPNVQEVPVEFQPNQFDSSAVIQEIPTQQVIAPSSEAESALLSEQTVNVVQEQVMQPESVVEDSLPVQEVDKQISNPEQNLVAPPVEIPSQNPELNVENTPTVEVGVSSIPTISEVLPTESLQINPETQSTNITVDTPQVELVGDQLPNTTDLVQPVEEQSVDTRQVENSSSVVSSIENFSISFFRTIGFVGLNTQQTNLKVVEKLNELANKLADFADVFIIDSAKGYAKTIFDTAKTKNIELTGMYLKPYHSTYSDEAELGDYDNFTVMMFSNSLDKVKNLIKESDIIVMPEINGLTNLSALFEIWSTNSLYPGQNKQLILLGKGWSTILTQLKTLFKLTDKELTYINVCLTTEEALAKISELDKEYLTKEAKQPRKVIDLREEDDEDGLFV